MAEQVQVNPPFTQMYLDIQNLCGQAIVAAARDDVDTLHKINHEMLSKSVNLAQFSFFGLTVQRMNAQIKKPEVDPPEHHPV